MTDSRYDASVNQPRGLTIMDALVNCPLVGEAPAQPMVAHRVEFDGLPLKYWETAEFADAVCGAKVKLARFRWKSLRTRGTKIKRCATCRTWRRVS